jgi:hypothetical protein
VAFAGSWRSEEVDDLATGDEAELGERQDAITVERWLEGEVEAGEGFDGSEAAHAQRGLDPAVLAKGQLFREEDVDGLKGGDLALLKPTYDMIEGFKGPRHLQADEVVPDPIDRRRRDVQGGRHGRRSWVRSWAIARPTAS